MNHCRQNLPSPQKLLLNPFQIFYINASNISKTIGIVTSHNQHCHIPWKVDVNGPELFTCTADKSSSGEECAAFENFWCATSVNDDLTYKEWDWCSSK